MEKLTPRELEVLRLVAEGLTHREIAERLSISIRTVDVHRLHLKEKLGLRTLGELVRYAIRAGLIES
ncbi:MAG: LuxR C-terminal-related transcriptional regulator [Candidatus Xenobia bacterium]